MITKTTKLLAALFLSPLFITAQDIGIATESQTATYLKSLYNCMNPADKADRSERFYIENAVNPAIKARAELPWGASVPEREFRYFVLPLRVNNEAIDNHRPIFYAELYDRVKNLSMTEAILEINHWCHEKATYQPSDGRTHSPLQTVSSAIGRCGEESTFTVAALRAMCIPARQVYTPRWAHTDDNHAWVEAWADGRWYFLGACEPEPVLNLGWFNAPASRGMLMHARVPGNDYDGPEEVLARMNGNTDINVTSNYAPVDTILVTVTDSSGTPIEGAEVTFRIYNYAEFYPLAQKQTDSNGATEIVAGLGDMLIWATDGSRFGFRKCRPGTDRDIVITLDCDSRTCLSADIDIIPPRPLDATVEVSATMRKTNDGRLLLEDSIRNAYTAAFANRDNADRLAEILDIDADRLYNILQKSRGNHNTVTAFLQGTVPWMRDKAIQLLESVSDKDLTDISLNILCDHLSAPPTGGDMFAEYVMSPRIDAEELTPFRSQLLPHFSESEILRYRTEPQLWAKFVSDSIEASLDWYPSQATMSPDAVWRLRQTSAKSRDIFFVAGARSIGIPSRIDPVTLKTQWADTTGQWHDATFTVQPDNYMSQQRGTLQLAYTKTRAVGDPKYYSHFTISKIVDGRPQLLNYPDFIPYSDTFATPQQLDCGQYMIVTGQRMADGSVLSHIDIVNIAPGENRGVLTLREDSTGIEVLGSFDSESRYMPAGENTARSLLSTTGRGYYVLGLIRPDHEPSNHALRDLSAEATAIEAWGRPIVLLTDSPESLARIDMTLMPELPSTVTFGSDPTGGIASQLTNTFRLTPTETPVFIIADTFNRVVYISQGYNIGLGQRIADIISRLE